MKITVTLLFYSTGTYSVVNQASIGYYPVNVIAIISALCIHAEENCEIKC